MDEETRIMITAAGLGAGMAFLPYLRKKHAAYLDRIKRKDTKPRRRRFEKWGRNAAMVIRRLFPLKPQRRAREGRDGSHRP